jgi:starvation-inducible DNA-binding protein
MADKKALATYLAEALADVVAYKATAQGFHWNVKGPEFTQFHKFFGKIYEDADSSVDPLAENIRKLGYDSPYTLQDFVSLACMEPRPVSGEPIEMCGQLYEHNQHIKHCLLKAFECASECNEQGIADFLAGRIDMHNKWIWQLGTITGADSTMITTI